MSTPILCKGVVIREVSYGESDKCLTVLSDTLGCIAIFCKGAKNYKSKAFVSAQQFCYSEFELYSRADRYWLKEGVLIDNFYGIREDITSAALAGYVCDVVADVTRENQKEPEILRLLLNTLYMLSRPDKPRAQLKAVFELRLCALAGFCPDLVGCAACGAFGEGEPMYFDPQGGQLYCSSHKGSATMLSAPAVKAMRHAVYAPPQRIFAFELAPAELAEFARMAERYLICQLERSFATLDFYHSTEKL